MATEQFSPLRSSEGRRHRHIKDSSPQGGTVACWSSPSLCSPCPSSNITPISKVSECFQMYQVGASVPQPLCYDGSQNEAPPGTQHPSVSPVCSQPLAQLASWPISRCAGTLISNSVLLLFSTTCSQGPIDLVINNSGVHS